MTWTLTVEEGETRLAVEVSPLWLVALGVAWVVHSRRLARQQELRP